MCQFFTGDIGLRSKLQRSLLIEIETKPILSVNKDGHDCLVIWNNSSRFKFDKLLDRELFMVGSVA